MKRLFQLLLVCFTLIAANAFAQENVCNNYLDDDGDGFIDCFDSDCSSNALCDDFYLGNDVACTPQDLPSNKFTMTMDFSSPNETTNHLSRMAIGDLNRDGIPEIVTMNRYTKRLFILNGSDGSIQSQTTVTWEPQWEIAIANLNNDGCAEIFFFGIESKAFFLYAYDCNLNFIWKSAQSLLDDPVNYGLADFDSDGKVELYAKDEIFDAHTGVRIVKSSATTSGSYNRLNGGPVAVDMDMNDNGKLELVIGLSIFKVNLGARTADAGSLTLLKKEPTYFVRYPFNATSVADYNLDGFLDVIASGSTIGNGKNTTVFFWDVQNNSVKTFSDPIAGTFNVAGCPASSGTFYKDGWQNGTGRINLADLDGDGKMNASYVSGKFLYALKEDFTLLWRVPVNEETSGYTGCTLFDFNGDGQSEIVYRDEKFIYIINGIDGSVNTQQACVSRTNREYPIVADVDADGSTEICVTCGFDDALAVANFCNINYSQYSHVRAFKSASEPWVAARRLWNQHGYFNVNVNNDLTIPRVQQKHHLPFSAVPCKIGQNTIPRPLNNFLNQSPYLDSKGCQVFAAPNLVLRDTLVVKPPTCPNQNFTVSFSIENLGDAPISGDVPITFYNGNPLMPGAIKLNTITVTLVAFSLHDVVAVSDAIVNGTAVTTFQLYVVLNDDGSSVPTPIKLAPNFIECNYDDNIDNEAVIPLPAPLTALKIQNNIVCSPGSVPNGAVRAFIPDGAIENTTDYNFYWSNGSVAKPVPADFIGPIYSNLPGGDYTVYALHKTANCGSKVVTISKPVKDSLRTIDVSIVLVSPNDNCKTPNGSLRAVVSVGGVVQPPGNYTYEWTQFGGNQILSNAATISNLEGGPFPYNVIAIEKATNCSNSFPLKVPNITEPPVVQVNPIDIVCSNANSGGATATVGGITAGFTFNWYRGSFPKPTTDFPLSTATGTISSQPAGFYTVEVINNATQCKSAPFTMEIKQTPAFTVAINKTSDQTSCDMTQLNGAATATPSAGSITDYSFEWFKGQNTLASSFIDSTSNTIAGLDVGIYTVKAKNRVTKCFDTEEVTINFAVVNPNIQTTSQGSSSKCSPPDGTAEVTSLSIGTFGDYTFEWYIGSAVTSTPDFPDIDEKITGLVPGDYTVKATSNITHCVTPPKTITVGSIIAAITINQTAIKNPDKCNEFGFITISASAPGNTLGFDFVWHKGNAPFQALPGTAVVTSTSTSSTLSQVLTGGYTVEVINRETGCSASRYSPLLFSGGQILFPDPVTDITTCVPGTGGIVPVQLVKSPAVVSEADYDIFVYQGPNDIFPAPEYRIIPGVNGFVGPYELKDIPSDPLLPGFYTFVAVLRIDGCRSEPLTMELKSNTINPVFTSAITDNVNCSPGVNPLTGQISLTISPPTPPDPVTTPADYNFVWSGPTATSPVLPAITTNVAPNLGGGIYTVSVTTKAGLKYAGCTTTEVFQVFDRTPIVSMDIALLDKTACIGTVLSNGTASVNTITEDGIAKFTAPGPSVDYPSISFQWFDKTQTLIPTGIGSAITDLIPSTYSVRATNVNNNCFTEKMFEIKDMTIGDPTVNLMSFLNPTNCLQPGDILGELHVDAAGTSSAAPPFKYRWFTGSDTTSFNAAGPDLLSISPATTPALTFTIKAINNTTKCFVLDTYVLQVETAPILLTASASSLTFCNSPFDGSVFATITSGSPGQYDYNWYDETVKATPDFTTSAGIQSMPLDSGNYIVIAVDKDPLRSATCFATATVTITSERVFPDLNVQSLRSLSVCDLTVAPADGVAEASIEGDDVINYNINWFRNGFPTVVFPTPTPSPFGAGSQVGGLADSTYYVVASHIVTGCLDSTKIKIDFAPLPIPFPQITILSQKTSCDEDNGALSVSVGGNTKDYIFDWFRKTGADTVYISTGEMIDSLSVDFYTVTATSRETGCVSVPVSEQIKEQIALPDFNFKIEPATCDQEDGFLTLFMTTTDIEIASIKWVLPSGDTIISPNVVNAMAGNYVAIVTTVLGCDQIKPIQLLTEIKPYNGVSVNGDTKNPIFQIDCIQNFPDNVVKIFNRAGTLVYEASGYDNQVTFFDGKSNKGISLMGTQLPGGTYFYVIDKRDGSKALAGYLEVVN